MSATVTRRRTLLALATTLATLCAAFAGAAAASTRVVTYRGAHVRVPAAWPVISLAAHPRACVRFDRHAVYLGRPSPREDCPAHAAGRTESILIAPRSARAHTMLATSASSATASPRGGRVVVTATWNRHPGLVRSALAGRTPARLAGAQARPAAARAPATGFGGPVTGGGNAGAIYTGLGFDACSAPSAGALSAWDSSPFHAVGVYIGGANMACSQPNLTSTWVTTETTAGWHLIPIYVGLQAPSSGCGCATISGSTAGGQGSAAAQDAIAHARALGLGAGNPIYYDMEAYGRSASSSAAVLAFLSAWTTQLHLAGYLSGVYSSSSSGIVDLASQSGSGYAEPDDLWVANWNGEQNTADSHVPAGDWPDHQRLHQYRGGHTDDYGGTRISIDSDYIDGATAAPGTGQITTTIASAPSIAVRPSPDGTIAVVPSWSGERGVARFRIVAGPSSTALATATTVRPGRPPVVVRSAYANFQAQALDATGKVMGSSGVVPTPPHVAIFGASGFVGDRGPGEVPVKCFAISACAVSVTVWAGHHRIASTHPRRVPGAGGIVSFPLSAADHRRVRLARAHGVRTSVTIRSTTGRRATRPLTLHRFSVSGRGPRVRGGHSSRLRILSTTGFVSHGHSGGVLAACASNAPCLVTTSVTAEHSLISSARPQTIGAGEVAYLGFRMTGHGTRMLRAARGNRLGARVTVSTAATPSDPATKAQALMSLSQY